MPRKQDEPEEAAPYTMDDVIQEPEPERKIPTDFLLPENHAKILHNQGLAIQDLAGLVDDAQREAQGMGLLFGKYEVALEDQVRNHADLRAHVHGLVVHQMNSIKWRLCACLISDLAQVAAIVVIILYLVKGK